MCQLATAVSCELRAASKGYDAYHNQEPINFINPDPDVDHNSFLAAELICEQVMGVIGETLENTCSGKISLLESDLLKLRTLTFNKVSMQTSVREALLIDKSLVDNSKLTESNIDTIVERIVLKIGKRLIAERVIFNFDMAAQPDNGGNYILKF